MKLLLTVTEDSATLRSDMSAVYEVGWESDATDIALFFLALHHPVSLILENPKAKNLGFGQRRLGGVANHAVKRNRREKTEDPL